MAHRGCGVDLCVLRGQLVLVVGHEVDAHGAVAIAQLEHDLTAAGSGLALMIGHKGTRLSGGQLQRLALARALAPGTELLEPRWGHLAG